MTTKIKNKDKLNSSIDNTKEEDDNKLFSISK